jgi:ketosteroid isomerase-like protein
MTPREVFERFVRTGMERDMRAQAELYAPDGVLEWPFAPDGVPTRIEGRDEIFRTLSALRAGSSGLEIDEAGTKVIVHETADPEVIVVELELAVGAARMPYVQVYQVRDGQIVSLRDYWGAGTGDYVRAALNGSA